MQLAKVAPKFGLLILALGLCSSAWASSITYSLNSSNLGAGYTGPFATVTVNLTSSTTADVSFMSDTNGGYIYLIGAHGAVAFSLAPGGYSFSTFSISNSLSGFTPGTFPSGSSFGTEDGYGSFFKLDVFDGFTHTGTDLSFTLTNLTGTWSSPSNVFTANSDGQILAVNVFACATSTTAPCTKSTGAPTRALQQMPNPRWSLSRAACCCWARPFLRRSFS